MISNSIATFNLHPVKAHYISIKESSNSIFMNFMKKFLIFQGDYWLIMNKLQGNY